MRILFVSGVLIGSALCQKLVAEKNDVKLYIHEQEWKKCLDGIVPKTEDWKGELDWVKEGNGIIIFDDVGFGKDQDLLRRDGYKVVGGSEGGDSLETERLYFQEIAQQSGMEILPSYNFSHADEAIAFVKKNGGKWVVKQDTHQSCLNFIGKREDGSDVLRVLENYKKREAKLIHIQQFANGIEVGIARYFNGNDWVGPIEINHEHKMLHDGDTGPLTPEMGTVLWYTVEECRLFTEVLDKLKPHLQKIDFRGDIDINCMVTKDRAVPLEATPRFGNPSTELQVILHQSPWADFLDALATGKQYPLGCKKGFGVVVSIVVPPFPYQPENSRNSISHIQINLNTEKLSIEDFEHIHFEEGSKIGDSYYWTGKHGAVLYVTAFGKTISEARDIAYNRVRHIHIPKMHYRKDIGVRVENHDLPRLQEWGWL